MGVFRPHSDIFFHALFFTQELVFSKIIVGSDTSVREIAKLMAVGETSGSESKGSGDRIPGHAKLIP